MTSQVTKASAFNFSSVLLVDDDSFMVELISDMLTDLGVLKVTAACNGTKGVEALQSARPLPEIVICDLNMPEKDGFQVMESLAEKKFSGGVILISGMGERIINSAELMGKFHQLNILDVLKKPVTRHALSDALIKYRITSSQSRQASKAFHRA